MSSEIIASYLYGTGPSSDTCWFSSMNDNSLRTGIIVNIIPPSGNDTTYSYDVLVSSSNGVRSTHIPYYKVKMASVFGGVADFCKWIPRFTAQTSSQFSLNNQVLVMCVNGNQREAYIIGGIDHPSGFGDNNFGNSIYLDFEYNGINVFIDEDGQLQLTRRGKTNADGTVDSNEQYMDSAYLMTKDGEHAFGYLDFMDPSNFTDYSFFRLSKKDKNILGYSKQETKFQADTNFIIETKNGFQINPSGAAQQAFLQGTDFRQQQQTLHQNMITDLANLTTALTSATAFLGLAATANAIPMTGGMAALPSFASMAAQLAQAIAAVTKLSADIAAFESQATTYLSKKHTHSD